MVQFVTKDEEELKFWRIFERICNQTLVDLGLYYRDVYKSPELGEAIYNNQIMPIYKTLEKSLFIKAFSEIIEGQKTLGTVDAYLRILYAIFGSNAQITITQQPMHLKVDIIAPIRLHYIWVTKDKKQIITKDGKAIVFKDLLAEVTDRELLQILKSTTKAGTYIEFTLNKVEE